MRVLMNNVKGHATFMEGNAQKLCEKVLGNHLAVEERPKFRESLMSGHKQITLHGKHVKDEIQGWDRGQDDTHWWAPSASRRGSLTSVATSHMELALPKTGLIPGAVGKVAS